MADPQDACHELVSLPTGQNHFLLVDDGGCSYYDKV